MQNKYCILVKELLFWMADGNCYSALFISTLPTITFRRIRGFDFLAIFDFRRFSVRSVKDFRISSEVWTIFDFLRFPEKCEGFSKMLNIIVISYILIIVP